MGEVRLCHDRVVGREVALKVLRPQSAAAHEARERFVREARVQGQLEHPAVVPVYDLGVTPGGTAYFTMKRVRGRTLDEIVRQLAAGDAEAREKYTRRRLLTALRSVCLAVDFAHRRGVLHRDLKPANVILGDFGEVYVLDWGLAKIAGESDPALAGFAGLEAAGPPGGHTLQGAMLGTPGYMAPEQVRGENERLDGRADVYALGAILFEAVALERLHEGPSVHEVLGSTLFGVDARASARGRLDVPPELEAMCVRATALDPVDRYPTARALADDLERLLDGDRNEALRRDLAARHVAAARAALGRAAGGGARAGRAEALREAASALALEPNHAEALATMARLLMEVPDEVPREAQAGLDAAAEATRVDTARTLASRFLSWAAFVPFALWMGVRAPLAVAAAVGAVLATSALAWRVWRRGRAARRDALGLLALGSAAVAGLAALFGPFVLVPGLAATNTMFFAMNVERGARRLVLGAGALIVVAPYALELLGLVPPSYAFRDGALLVLPRATSLPPVATTCCLLAASVAMVVAPGAAVGRLRDRLHAAEHRLHMQAWNLSQLVPSAARAGLGAPRPGDARDRARAAAG
jgi:serine/threonine-protein kinase